MSQALPNPNDDAEALDAVLDEDVELSGLKEAGLYYPKDLSEQNISPSILQRLPKDMAAKYRLIPVSEDENGKLLLVTDTADSLKHVGEIGQQLGFPVEILISADLNVQMALNKYYDISNYQQVDASQYLATEDASPLKHKVLDLLHFCIEKNASDLHLLPYTAGIYVQLRINGFIVDYTNDWTFQSNESNLVINILKQLDTSNNADVTNAQMPNSGHFTFYHGDVRVECRLETVPVGNALLGRQKVNVRFQPQTKSRKTLETIYSGKDLKDIRQTLYRGGAGLYLNSGPVGTGKTTALYAEIGYLWNLAEKTGHRLVVYCIENPIEYQDERYTQVEVRLAENEKLSLTSQVALKSALRSDPDIILYGEIRDSEDAGVAMRACQTGLKMFSTIHAGDCIRTINRLLDLDVSRMSLLAEMKIIICQRLIGLLCPKCSRPHHLTEDEKSVLTKREIAELSKANLRERGSEADRKACTCQDGLIGRIAVPEYVIFDDELRDALLHMNNFRSVPNLLRQHGFVSMWDKGLGLVQAGQAELADVIQKIGRD